MFCAEAKLHKSVNIKSKNVFFIVIDSGYSFFLNSKQSYPFFCKDTNKRERNKKSLLLLLCLCRRLCCSIKRSLSAKVCRALLLMEEWALQITLHSPLWALLSISRWGCILLLIVAQPLACWLLCWCSLYKCSLADGGWRVTVKGLWRLFGINGRGAVENENVLLQ